MVLLAEAGSSPMSESSPSAPGQSDNGPIVALLLPSLVDAAVHGEGLGKTLGVAPGAVHLLVCIPEGPAEPLVSMLAGLKVDVQILLGHEADKPQADALVVRAPAGMSQNDLLDFAFALCDVVLVGKGYENRKSARHASQKLGKALVTIGSTLYSPSPAFVDAATDLDPDLHPWGRRIFGRVERGMLECLALIGWGDEKTRKNRFWRSFLPNWGPAPYFAPATWESLCPDKAAVEKSSPLVRCFDAMDRSALYGSYKHRDVAWVTHFGVAGAVAFAVAGYVAGWFGPGFSGLEFLLLLWVGSCIWQARRTNLQDRWTARRLGAEQLRIARMSLPLLVLPPALATADAEDWDERDNEAGRFEFAALNRVKRAVREQGLPHVDYSNLTAAEAGRWLRLIVADQMRYHQDNHLTLERAERSLSFVTAIIFLLSMLAAAAVLGLHLLGLHDYYPRWLMTALMVATAGPAFAAALHGAGMRLGIVHRAALSREMQRQLKETADALEQLVKGAASSPRALQEARELAYEAAEAMGAENSSWHHLVRRYKDELP
jgi:hypothetical protein